MRVRVERWSKIRVAQQRLSSLDRFPHFCEQRRMCMPEQMPGNMWLFDPITRGRKHTEVWATSIVFCNRSIRFQRTAS